MSDAKGTKEISPFGNPDGSRADIEEMLKGFIGFGGSDLWGGLATRDDDLTARVIVGRKGSGKTVYLRRLQAFAANQDSLYADHIQQSLPTTENIIKFCQLFEENILTEKWMILWHRAILRSTISHLLHNKKFKNIIKSDMHKIFYDKYHSILRDFGTPLSIYSQITEITQMHHSKHSITKYLNNPLWQELEWLIGDLIRDCPPICFYIDAVDEEFSHAPMYWQRCQKGLFYQTMRLLRDARLGGRLHVVICIRDIVLSSVYRSEHRTRYKEEPHIRILTWSKDAIEYFLEKKLKNLDDKYFIGDIKYGKNVMSWLGIEKIKNLSRNIYEPLGNYLLRHTRLLPRDIVILGNSLCREFVKYKTIKKGYELEDIIRNKVAEVAKFLGDEQLIICGNQIASNLMPKHAALHGYSEVYTSSNEHIRGITDYLKKLIRSIGKERFSYNEFVEAQKISLELFNEDVDPFSILWQNGLLGYCEDNNMEGKFKFYSEAYMDDFNIPLEKDSYVFHSCLIDSVGIKHNSKNPISY